MDGDVAPPSSDELVATMQLLGVRPLDELVPDFIGRMRHSDQLQ